MTDRALRWWEAVLATDEGWDASVLQNKRNLKSPWSLITAFTTRVAQHSPPPCFYQHDIEYRNLFTGRVHTSLPNIAYSS
ncbi:hypothetical protein CRV24_000449 [Beauveria bassiana]|nr:hypothetical protein CRV24_000449 [Beauveria bassiana]